MNGHARGKQRAAYLADLSAATHDDGDVPPRHAVFKVAAAHGVRDDVALRRPRVRDRDARGRGTPARYIEDELMDGGKRRGKVIEEFLIRATEGKDRLVRVAAHDGELGRARELRDHGAGERIEQLRVVNDDGVPAVLRRELRLLRDDRDKLRGGKRLAA